jgi:cytochrome c-type biogenesis protein CcmE
MGGTLAPTRRPSSMVRWPLILVALALVGAFGFLGFNAFKSASMYYLTPSELVAKGEDIYNDDVRLSGMVATGTIESYADNVFEFTVTDDEGAMIPVVYKGAVPDTFQEGADVVVEGRLTPHGVFEADHLLAKCPSKYEAQSGGQ